MRLSRRHGSLTTPSSPLADPTPGSLHLTAHHLIFKRDSDGKRAADSAQDGNQGDDEEVWVSLTSDRTGAPRQGTCLGAITFASFETHTRHILQIPLTLLHSVTRTPPSLTGEPAPLVVRTRDYLTYELAFTSATDADLAWDNLKAQCGALSTGGLEGRYALAQPGTELKGKERANGWQVYDVEAEFARMGMGTRSKAWRFTNINADFQVGRPPCSSSSSSGG